MKQLVKLGFDEAISAIQNEKVVMYKHGVWNSYKKVATSDAIKSIKSSGYGADVYTNDEGIKYVSIPSDGDMW